ncbi:hypothetical protein CYLTODRAFT_485455 [Cylindrobasidium torrendii FP15055 ss-10]|uniref:Uncharacterized protein n=1 Tax=Cylindrobasidium torrendii FP15055 ss-10 TaxID=1314674 RepID=A0A0D7BST0_9AGAR|nr:hypothetical protein CYLTODRAFT_485455 [Cylindrobasidium torrendii FP15055 ss-10]
MSLKREAPGVSADSPAKKPRTDTDIQQPPIASQFDFPALVPLLSPKRLASLLLKLSSDPVIQPRIEHELRPVLESIFLEYDKSLVAQIKSSNRKCTDCDEAGSSMFRFMDKVKSVAQSPDGSAKTRAWALTMELIENSWVDCDLSPKACGYGEDRGFKSNRGDVFALDIAKARWNEGVAQGNAASFWPEMDQELEQLDEDASYLADYGVEPYFPTLREQLRAWSQERSLKRNPASE